MTKKIAIVGAAASGLPAIKCCLDEGLTPVCFERTDDIGGLWNFRDRVVDDQACVMKTTVINTSKEMTSYSDFPMPEDFPNLCHNTKMMEYFRMYADKFKLLQYIRFRHEIVSIKKRPDFESTGQWSVMVTDLSSDAGPVEEVYDGVMLCTGHHAMKNEPTFPGQDTFKGTTLHTNDYRTPQGYEDKVAVVVGVGNSGGDISVELSKVCKQVYLSTRRGVWVGPRVAQNGVPNDYCNTTRYNTLKGKILGYERTCTNKEAELNRRIDHKAYGLQPKHRVFAQHPCDNDEFPNRLISGAIKLKPNIERFLEDGVEFTDGTKEDVDIVVFATGYKFGFPFLDKEVLDVQNNEVNLYKQAFVPDLQPNTLAIIGCMQPLGSVVPCAELQSRWVARVFKGVTKLPSPSEMWGYIKDKQAWRKGRYVATARHTIQVDYVEFMDDVAEEFGAKPNLAQMFLSDPVLAYTCFFGPCTPYQYRLVGPGKWSGARDAILNTEYRLYKGFHPKSRPPESSMALPWYLVVTASLALVAYLLTRL